MTVEMKDIANSSHLARYGYDPEAQTLHVEFKSGASGTHAGVTPEMLAEFESAESKGGAYHAMFRGRAAHPWTPAGKPSGEKHEGTGEPHPLTVAGVPEDV